MKPFVRFRSKQSHRRARSISPWSCDLERLEERKLLVASITSPAAVATLEDTAKAITGVSFTSTAATDTITVTMTVTNGTITVSSSVTNGLSAAQITNNGTASVTVSATVTVVNLTFANAAGVTYTPNANFNGPDTLNLHLVNNSSETADSPIALTITAVNDAPSFTLPDNRNQLVAALPGDVVKTVIGFATNMKKGPDDEVGQVLDFQVTTTNPALFAVPPTIDSVTGTLNYTLNVLAPNVSGTAIVSVKLHDNGGTANGGSNTSAAQTFTITAFGPVNPVYNSVAGSKLRAFVVSGVLVVQANGIPFVSYPSAAIQSLTFNGGAKNDEIDLSGVTLATFPNLGTVKINGGAGNDRIVGSYRADLIDGGSGNDTLQGGLGNDTISGGSGYDGISGQTGNDSLLGGDGNDTVLGGIGDDKLFGGNGNDLLIGGTGADTLTGDAGRDTVCGGQGGPERGGTGMMDPGDTFVSAEIIDESFKKLFAWE